MPGVLIWGCEDISEKVDWLPVLVDSSGHLQIDVLNTVEVITSTQYTIAIAYDANQNVEYVGEAATGSSKGDTVWRIKKLTYDANGNVTDVQWADGVATFTKEWDERASYSYS